MLISKFTDYYDHIFPNAFKDVKWVRETKKVELTLTRTEYIKLRDIFREYEYNYTWKGFEYPTTYYIFLCEKTYPFFKIPDDNLFFPNSTKYFPISDDDLIKLDYKKSYQRPRKKESHPFLKELHHKLNTPVFTYLRSEYLPTRNYKCTFIVDINLSEYEFSKKLSPAQAYQEIIMYLSTFDKPVEPEPIEDKIKAKMLGHSENSFKAGAPGQKKLNRKRNKKRKKNEKIK